MKNKLKVLVVEDDRTNLLLMCKLVERAGNCIAVPFNCSLDVARSLPSLAFDIAIVDHQMPGMNGIELIKEMKDCPVNRDKPIVMVTAYDRPDVRLAALEAGAMEFLAKPVDTVEFATRIRSLAQLCDVQRQLGDREEWLRTEVQAATAELRRREEEIIQRLTLAAGYKDDDTGTHTVRMAQMCGRIAKELGLTPEACRDIELAAPMHDIGKVGIRDDVLLKEGRLDEAETAHMRQHTRIGSDILVSSSCDLLRLAAVIAETHHERWDGTGYPANLKGTEIPLVGRIAAVADVFDALISVRPYKRAWSEREAMSYISQQAGRQFDPDCVEAFLRSVDFDYHNESFEEAA